MFDILLLVAGISILALIISDAPPDIPLFIETKDGYLIKDTQEAREKWAEYMLNKNKS